MSQETDATTADVVEPTPAKAAAEEPLAFDRADFGSASDAPPECAACKRPLGSRYFTINDAVTCDDCHHLVTHQLKQSKSAGAFVRAAMLGAGAALAGSIAWYAVAKITGMEIGLLAIAVGYLVGHAVRRGSRSPGGRRYQALAMLLTYLSITGSYVPLVVKTLSEKQEPALGAQDGSGAETKGDRAAARAAGANAPVAPAASVGAPPPADSSATTTSAEATSAVGPLQLVLAAVVVFGIAFIAPFLAGASNIIGLLLIGIALYEAWKLNKRVPFVIAGPLRTSKLRAAA